jgi:hypothetical protein
LDLGGVKLSVDLYTGLVEGIVNQLELGIIRSGSE